MERVGGYSMFEVLRELSSAAAGWVSGTVRAFIEARAQAAADRDLRFLSDHLLRDIGLQRSDFRA